MDYLSEKLEQLLVFHHSTVMRICKRNEKTGSADKIKRCGRPKKLMFGERDMFVVLQSCIGSQVWKLLQIK